MKGGQSDGTDGMHKTPRSSGGKRGASCRYLLCAGGRNKKGSHAIHEALRLGRVTIAGWFYFCCRVCARTVKQAKHPRHLGRRHRLVQHQRLQYGYDGRPHPQHRPDRKRRCDIHGLLRTAELHGGQGRVCHRTTSVPHGTAEGRPPRRGARAAGLRIPRLPIFLRIRAT